MITHSKPYTDSLEKNAVIQALNEGYLAAGKKTKELETLISASTGYPSAILTSSASYALFLILKTCFPTGARVALQSFVCRSIYDSILMAGCMPVVVDINSTSFGINTTEAIQHDIDVAVITHLFGVRSDFSEFIKSGIPVIEDCAQRIVPSDVKEQQEADWRIYSFDATKIITCGQGGAIIGKDEQSMNKIKQQISGAYSYEAPCLINTFSDIQASIAIEQWKKINSFLSIRKKIALFYINELKKNKLEHIIHPSMMYDDTWHFRFIIQVESPETMITRMEKCNIVCRKPINPYGLHTLFDIKGNYSETEFATQHLLSIPLYPALSENQSKYIIHSLINCYG